jgi:2-keto-4-pentenoate hydratase/2-oxohepta-3-ene-1,7-dioic acid hydratase in catechol pathway
MRFARIGEPGRELDAAWDGQAWRDISTLTSGHESGFLSDTAAALRRALAGPGASAINEAFRFGAPLQRIGKIVCIGLNYRDHAKETGTAEPAEPIVFMKAPDTVVGPNDEVLTFNPMGPWLVTSDEVGDPQALGMRLWVNDTLRQDGNTANMIFDVAYLIWYLSQFLVLYPGDVINTGTPAGVALAQPDEPYLRAGDVVPLEIDRLGRQRQIFVQA